MTIDYYLNKSLRYPLLKIDNNKIYLYIDSTWVYYVGLDDIRSSRLINGCMAITKKEFKKYLMLEELSK